MCKRLRFSGKSIPQDRLFRNRQVFLPIYTISGFTGCMYLQDRFLHSPEDRKLPRKPDPGRKRRSQAVWAGKVRGGGTVRETVSARGAEGPQDIDDPDARKRTEKGGPPAACLPPGQGNIWENGHYVYRVQGKYNKKSNKYKKIFKHVRTLFFAVVNVSGVSRDVKKGRESRKILHIVLAKSAKREYTFPR